MIDYKYGVMLGPLDSSHKQRAREWRNNPEIFRWCRQKTLLSDREHEDWFERQAFDPAIKMFSIQTKEHVIGVCGFTSIDHFNRRAEFSLYIGKEHHGFGYGKNALQTLLAHGFLDLGFNSIWGETFDGNRAVKTFEDVGMTKEGTRRQFYFKNGKMVDAHLYSILRTEWKL